MQAPRQQSSATLCGGGDDWPWHLSAGRDMCSYGSGSLPRMAKQDPYLASITLPSASARAASRVSSSFKPGSSPFEQGKVPNGNGYACVVLR